MNEPNANPTPPANPTPAPAAAVPVLKPAESVTSPVAPNPATSSVSVTTNLTPEMVNELVAKGIAEAQVKWEAERVPKLTDQITERITAPIRRDAKIKSLREELRSAGKYLPADDDNSDPTSPGDLAALTDLDDVAIVAKDKAGNGLTRLDVELGRTRSRLTKRKSANVGDHLATPPVEVAADEFAKIRADVKAKHDAAAANSQRPLSSVFGGFNR